MCMCDGNGRNIKCFPPACPLSNRISLCRLSISTHGCGCGWESEQSHYWASVSEPHTSDVNATFPLYHHHHHYHGTYLVLYILYSPILAYYATEISSPTMDATETQSTSSRVASHSVQRDATETLSSTDATEPQSTLSRETPEAAQRENRLRRRRERKRARQFPCSRSPHNVLHSPS